MAVAQLGDLKWRVDPQRVNWSYQIDANRIETLGGQVIQVLGATLSDLTIMGQFGQDHQNKLESWQLAVAFNTKIQQMMDAQTLPAKTVGGLPSGTSSVSDAAVVHKPVTFSYLDGKHNWQFQVLIKSMADADGSNALTHAVGKSSYGYTLTLFIVEADTDVLAKIATDQFISRISSGLGWTRTAFNGALKADEVQAYIDSTGGLANAFLNGALTGGVNQAK